MAEESAAPAVEFSPELAARAQEAGWPEDLVLKLLQRGARPADLIRYMRMGVTADQVRQFLGAQGGAGAGQQLPPPQLDLTWMRIPTEWGTRAKPTKRGLTLEAINLGKYGEVPDTWEYQTEMPRGAIPILGVEGMGYSVYEKQELWAENAASLYEEAIQRRWRPATDISWGTIEPLPADIERAICQICTHLSEKAQLEADVLAGWQPELSYGYHEVKLYLSTVIFEGARHAEVFRKRALCNGGGLGLQSPGWGFRSIADARNFTEMVAIQMVLQDSFTLVQHQHGEAFARNPAEKLIFRLAMQDKARHIAYGIAHLRYVLLHRADRRQELERYLGKGEAMLVADDRDSATREAFAILLGGGKERIREGLKRYEELRRRQVQQYLDRLRWATIDRLERLNPALRAYVQTPEGAGAQAGPPGTAGRILSADLPEQTCLAGRRRFAMPTFPSVQWFEAVRQLVNSDEAFRRLGTIDARAGVKVGDQLFEVTFEAFECTGVREIQEGDLRDLDFWLEQSPEEWREMLENIKQHGAADLQHTLNTIDLNQPEGFARSYDGYRRDAFYRFNQSLQHFFDSSSQVETQFAVGAGTG